MKIEKMTIRDFRNISLMDLSPEAGLNVFTGDNGQGKTNLLEAIFVLASGGSFRRAGETNFIKNGTKGYKLSARYTIEGREIENILRYSIDGSKTRTINNKKTGLNNQDRLRVVIFTPDDLFLIKGSPSRRRTFLDFILKQIIGSYRHDLETYIRTLKKRNDLLKKGQTAVRYFMIMNDVFVENAVRIIIQRINFVNLLEEICQPIYRQINEGRHEMKMKYALSFRIDNDKINMDALKKALYQHIEENRTEEIKRRITLVGPHLEDINVYHDQQPAQFFASQGQQRNLSISMKLAELYAFHSIKGFYPLLLLDDVLSELDERKREKLLEYLRRGGFQSFLTAVNTDGMTIGAVPKWRVEGGRLH